MSKIGLNNFRLILWSIYRKYLFKHPELNYLFWECTNRCNFKCSHCGSNCQNNPDLAEEEITSEEIKKTFLEVASKYKPQEIMVVITGGEPLLRKDLFEVAEYINKLGFHWGLVTNGYFINKDNVEKIKKTKLYSISISIDGLENTHDKFRGIPGSYKKALNGIELLRNNKAANYIEVTTVFSKHNINELNDIYRELLKLPIDSWKILFAEPIGRAENNINFLSKSEIIKVLNFIKQNRKNKTKFIPTLGCSGFFGPEYERKIRN